MDNLSVCWQVFFFKFQVSVGTFPMTTNTNICVYYSFIFIHKSMLATQFQENPMLLVPQQGYCLGTTRSIGFSWNCIMSVCIKRLHMSVELVEQNFDGWIPTKCTPLLQKLSVFCFHIKLKPVWWQQCWIPHHIKITSALSHCLDLLLWRPWKKCYCKFTLEQA